MSTNQTHTASSLAPQVLTTLATLPDNIPVHLKTIGDRIKRSQAICRQAHRMANSVFRRDPPNHVPNEYTELETPLNANLECLKDLYDSLCYIWPERLWTSVTGDGSFGTYELLATGFKTHQDIPPPCFPALIFHSMKYTLAAMKTLVESGARFTRHRRHDRLRSDVHVAVPVTEGEARAKTTIQTFLDHLEDAFEELDVTMSWMEPSASASSRLLKQLEDEVNKSWKASFWLPQPIEGQTDRQWESPHTGVLTQLNDNACDSEEMLGFNTDHCRSFVHQSCPEECAACMLRWSRG